MDEWHSLDCLSKDLLYTPENLSCNRCVYSNLSMKTIPLSQWLAIRSRVKSNKTFALGLSRSCWTQAWGISFAQIRKLWRYIQGVQNLLIQTLDMEKYTEIPCHILSYLFLTSIDLKFFFFEFIFGVRIK